MQKLIDQLTALADSAVAQAEKAGIDHNPEIIRSAVGTGLPESCEFAVMGHGTVRRRGERVEFVRDGKVVRQATVSEVGFDRLLVMYAIDKGRLSMHTGHLSTGSFPE